MSEKHNKMWPTEVTADQLPESLRQQVDLLPALYEAVFVEFPTLSDDYKRKVVQPLFGDREPMTAAKLRETYCGLRLADELLAALVEQVGHAAGELRYPTDEELNRVREDCDVPYICGYVVAATGLPFRRHDWKDRYERIQARWAELMGGWD